jgi:hypothetical protein
MLLVHVEHPSPRSTYVIRHVFERMLGIPVQWAQGLEEFRNATGARLSYSVDPIDGAFHMPWTAAIDALPKDDPVVVERDGLPALFPTEHGQDLFAGIFFLLSLTDEVRCTERDAHGRVPSSALFSVRKDLADRPWVDEVVVRLGVELEHRWPGEVEARLRYANVVTVDMDNILRYAGRPVHRALGASFKDLLKGSFSAVVERWIVRAGRAPDPYAKAIELIEAHRDDRQRAILFFLMRGEGTFDHASDPLHPATKALIQRAARTCEIGVHPSYDTAVDSDLAAKERIELQQVIGKGVRISRQHFLRWRIPETLRSQCGFNHPEDHTLGFSDRPGFRASTCTPFPWYDLEREEETKLMLWPFAVMDSALIERMAMGPEEVVRTMNAMSDAVRAVSGTFVSVWHDRYLSGHREFAPWPAVFEQVVRHARL